MMRQTESYEVLKKRQEARLREARMKARASEKMVYSEITHQWYKEDALGYSLARAMDEGWLDAEVIEAIKLNKGV